MPHYLVFPFSHTYNSFCLHQRHHTSHKTIAAAHLPQLHRRHCGQQHTIYLQRHCFSRCSFHKQSLFTIIINTDQNASCRKCNNKHCDRGKKSPFCNIFCQIKCIFSILHRIFHSQHKCHQKPNDKKHHHLPANQRQQKKQTNCCKAFPANRLS